jgi:hypothetical protein
MGNQRGSAAVTTGHNASESQGRMHARDGMCCVKGLALPQYSVLAKRATVSIFGLAVLGNEFYTPPYSDSLSSVHLEDAVSPNHKRYGMLSQT